MNRLFCLLFLITFCISCSNNQKQAGKGKSISTTDAKYFDQIIFASSNCMKPCQMSNIIINSDGSIVYKGQGTSDKLGFYVGKLSKKTHQQLFDKFAKIDFDTIKTEYRSLGSDQQTVSTTFLKNGRIYRTIYDYGRRAPASLSSSYNTLENLYKIVDLKKLSSPGFIPHFNDITTAKLKKGNMVLDITQSETFLLSDYLRKGKITINNIHRRFILHVDYDEINPLYDVETDGRLYKFLVKGKPVTIDIGFNFYDLNKKNWQWRKATKYD